MNHGRQQRRLLLTVELSTASMGALLRNARSGWKRHSPPCTRRYGRQVRTTPPPRRLPRPRSLIRLRLTEALEAATASLSVAAQERAAKDAKKKAAQAEKAEQKQADKMANSVVTIKRVERNKRKYVTAVSGLEAFGLELKKVAKEFGKKFATGSSVTRLPSGGEEIVVQGDVSDEIEEFLLEKYKEIPEDNIELVEDKKKKSSG